MLSYIFSYTSALPFNLQTGTDRNGDTNVNDRPLGVGRNTGEGFSYNSLDLRLARTFRLTESLHLAATVDAFNVFNHRNDQLPINVVGAQLGRPQAVGEPRQMQLGLKVSF
jgi:hypothetical protein